MTRFIVWGYPWLLRGLLPAAGALLALSLPALSRELRLKVSRNGWLCALALAAAAGLMRSRAPVAHRVFFDEYEHADIARNLARQGAFAVSEAAGPKLDALDAPLWPGAAHQIFAWAGPRWNAAASALTVPAVWAAATLAFGETAGLAAGLLWLFFPVAQAFAGTGAIEPTAALFCALGLTALLGERPWAGLLLLLCAAHSRPECAVLLPLAWLLPRSRRLPWWAAAPSAVLLAPIPVIAWLNRARGVEGYTGTAGQSAGLFAAHLAGNLGFLLSPAGLCWALALPALLGAWLRRREPRARALAGAAAVLLAVYTAYAMGDFTRGGGERYALVLLVPLAPLAGAAFLWRRPAAGLAAAALAAGMAWRAPLPALDPEHLREQAILARGRAELPANAFVIAFSVPAVVTEAGRSAIGALLYLEGTQPPPGPLYVLRDYWTAHRPADAARLDAALAARYQESPAVVDDAGWGFYALTPKRSGKFSALDRKDPSRRQFHSERSE